MRHRTSLATAVGHAARALRRRPGAALVSVGILAVGIGASIAVFTVARAVLVAPLPYDRPERLTLVQHRGDDAGGGRVPGPAAAAYGRAASVDGIGYVQGVRDGIFAGPDGAEPVRVGVASSSLFEVLGVRLVAGRLPASQAEAETAAEALISDGFWRARLGGRADALGEPIVVDGTPLRVAGVLPPSFRLALPPSIGLPERADVWLALPVPLEELRRPDRLRDQDTDNRGIVVARLVEGVRPSVAAAELTAIRRRLSPERGEPAASASVAVVPLGRAATAAARPVLVALLGAVLLVLVLTAANVSALLLARSVERGPELAVRAALGAGRGELTALVLAEGAVIGAAAGPPGLLVGLWGRDLLLRFHPPSLGVPPAAPFDGAVLAFAAGATLLATTLASTLPALRAGAPRSLSALRTDAARAPGGGGARARRLLVSAEIACALALLTGAGLLTRTALNLAAVDKGFDPGPVTTFELALVDADRYRGPADRGRFVRALAERLATQPSVVAAGVIAGIPLSGETFTQPWGWPDEAPDAWREDANFRVVSDGYFDAVGTRLVAGRAFRPEDDRQDLRVVVVDRALAAALGHDPAAALGRSIAIPLDGQREVARIVGVVEDVRFEDLRAPGAPTIYVPYRHEASRRITVAVRGTGDRPLPRSLLDATVAEVDPGLPVLAYAPMREHVRRATSDTRFALGVFTAFAALASLLAAIGIYAVVARWVGARTPEIGIRMALGADRQRVARLVLGETLLLVVPGVIAGLLLAAALGVGARALLFGVRPLDLTVLLAVTALVVLAALAAAIFPALRAARLPPASALRA